MEPDKYAALAAELRALKNDATEGRWFVPEYWEENEPIRAGDKDDSTLVAEMDKYVRPGADAALIVSLVNNIDAILSALSLAAQAERERKVVEAAMAMLDADTEDGVAGIGAMLMLSSACEALKAARHPEQEAR
jgi:hypothetical protein